ncbi:MAG: D-amino acid aminotransferase [Rickettsiales bacterium]|nr:D-amino acid aminotransferase [Rickettsiales bacterium]
MGVVYVNGIYQDVADAVIPMEDRAHQFADGVYEVIAFFNGKLLDAQRHLERLDYSCGELKITNPHSHAEWMEIVGQMVERNEHEHGGVYLQVSRGTQSRSHVYTEAVQPNVTLSAFGQKTPGKRLTEQGASVITYPDLRWKRCDIKTTGLLGNVMAKQAATEAGASEAILIKENGDVSEASISNFFIVKEGVVQTHPSTNEILSGIAREVTLRIARDMQIKVLEKPFSQAEMLAADEAFLTGTTTNILPVVKVDDSTIGSGTPGAITQRLLGGFIEHIKTQTGYTLWS